MKAVENFKAFLYNLYQLYIYTRGRVKPYRTGASKQPAVIFRELLGSWLRQGEFPSLYYAMGLHLQGSHSEDYIGRREFLKLKHTVEKHLRKQAHCETLNYDVLCKDKFVAGTFLKANGFATPDVLAVVRNGRIYTSDFITYDLSGLFSYRRKFVLKQITLEAGEGVLVCETAGKDIRVNGVVITREKFERKYSNNIYIMQDWLVSHAAIRKINDTALNTLRIVTVLKGSEPEFLGAFQAFATGGANTDAWSKGSVYVGLDVEKGVLKADGYQNLQGSKSGIVLEHPDSRIEFRDYPIPFLKEAIGLCIKAHGLLYFNYVVGWDVAITDNGPVIIEANEKPGMNVVQCICGGMREKLIRYADYAMTYRKLIIETEQR